MRALRTRLRPKISQMRPHGLKEAEDPVSSCSSTFEDTEQGVGETCRYSRTPRLSGLGRGRGAGRRLQVRFLSHLPLSPEFMRAAAIWRAAQFACVDAFDLNGTST